MDEITNGAGIGIGRKAICYICRVLSVHDDYKGLRIKVWLEGVDKGMPSDPTKYDAFIENLPYCFPAMPKFVHVNPRVGELVLVFLQTIDGFYGNRFFIGPIISQDYFLKQEYDATSRTLLNEHTDRDAFAPQPNPDADPANHGTIPEREDIALRGRSNSDVILKDGEVWIRCGFNEDPDALLPHNLVYNEKDPAAIQLKYEKSLEHDDYNSSVNVIADRINLISHDSRTDFTGLLTDPDKMVTEEGMRKILEDAHPIPYGDNLIAFLTEFVRIFKTHVHAFVKSPVVLNANDTATLSQDLTKMLSQSIRVN